MESPPKLGPFSPRFWPGVEQRASPVQSRAEKAVKRLQTERKRESLCSTVTASAKGALTSPGRIWQHTHTQHFDPHHFSSSQTLIVQTSTCLSSSLSSTNRK